MLECLCLCHILTSQVSSQTRVIVSEFLSKNWTPSPETEFIGIVPSALAGETGFSDNSRKLGLWSWYSCLENNKCTPKQLHFHRFWYGFLTPANLILPVSTQISSVRDPETFCQEPDVVADWVLCCYPELALLLAHIESSQKANTPWMTSCVLHLLSILIWNKGMVCLFIRSFLW